MALEPIDPALDRSRQHPSPVSRRTVLGGLLTGAALGAVPGVAGAAARSVHGDVKRSGLPLRLGANENSAGLAPAAREAFLAAAEEANRYPGGVEWSLVDAIAARHDVGRDWILLTPGSGELLRATTAAFTGPSRALVTAAPTYEAPTYVASSAGASVVAVPVTGDGALDLAAMGDKAQGAGLLYVCNPNNPTGGIVAAAAVAELAARVKAAAPDARILIDEAYFHFVEDAGYATAIPLAVANPRVLVTRTFSKIFGMAGLRIGYAIAHPDTLAELRIPRSRTGVLCSASLAAASAAFADQAYAARERARVADVRRFTRERFEAAGCRVLPSQANFVMIDVHRDAGAFGAACRREQVLVGRPFPPLTTFVRLTIGTQAEMDEAVPAMLGLLGSAPSARLEASPAPWSPGREC